MTMTKQKYLSKYVVETDPLECDGLIAQGQVLNLYQIANCCGMDIFTEFAYNYDDEDYYYTKQNIKENISSDLHFMKDEFSTPGKLIIINHKQERHLRSVILENGFKEIYRFHSKNHGNDIILFAYSSKEAKHPIPPSSGTSKTK